MYEPKGAVCSRCNAPIGDPLPISEQLCAECFHELDTTFEAMFGPEINAIVDAGLSDEDPAKVGGNVLGEVFAGASKNLSSRPD